jgi:hypothetical protein
MRNEPVVVTRSQVGQWASIVGGAALLTGIIGFIWQGGVTSFVLAALAIGVLGIGLWVLMTPQDFTGFVTGRKVLYGTSAVFSTLLLVGIAALTFVVLQRAVLTLDMTADQRFSLSETTTDVLRRIDRDIQITGFYSAQGLLIREVDDPFFRLYEVASNGHIRRRYVNPDEEPGIAANFAQRFGGLSEGDVFVSFLDSSGNADLSTAARVPRGSRQERDITEAIARLLLSGTLKVYFEISHGELDPLDTSQQGLAGVNAGIQESGLLTSGLNLADLTAAGGRVPEDASALIMARPLTDLSTEEIGVLDEYLQGGGALFIMADVLLTENAFLRQDSPFNQYLWENYGLRALDAVVVDRQTSQGTEVDIIGAAVATGTDLGERLDPAIAPALFRIARAVEVQSENPPTNNGWILASSPESYGETNLQALLETNTWGYDAGPDPIGPLNIAAWSWDQDTDARIVLVGDSDFVTNGYVCEGCPIGNAILFTDALSWLTRFNERIRFPPQVYSIGPLIFISGQTLDLIAFLTVVVLPGLVLVAGAVVWWRRNRR